MAVEEDAFPRGGGRSLTGLERKRLRQEAEADARRDFLGEWQEGSTAKRRKGHQVSDTLDLRRVNVCVSSCRRVLLLLRSTFSCKPADLVINHPATAR